MVNNLKNVQELAKSNTRIPERQSREGSGSPNMRIRKDSMMRINRQYKLVFIRAQLLKVQRKKKGH